MREKQASKLRYTNRLRKYLGAKDRLTKQGAQTG
jgi:hypothetical protein